MTVYIDHPEENYIEEVTSEQIRDELQAFVDSRVQKFKKFEKYGQYWEKYSISYFIHDYIRWFNENVRDYGDGFATDWDPDDSMAILYKDGTIRHVDVQWDDGDKRIKSDGIDSIILESGWGTAVAGPHIIIEDITSYEDLPQFVADFG